jgi:DNA-binding GntR family transcriptional regulator
MPFIDPAPDEKESLRAIVYRVLRGNIDSGVLPPGTLLTESGLANKLLLSREPVRWSLQQLHAEGVLERQQRGFLIAGAARAPGGAIPALHIPEAMQALIRGRTEWQKIWDLVLDDLIACMPFGRYKVVEVTMAAHYGVSRTVTRDILGRLESMRLIEREGRSQCYLRQLTPELMSELYAVRRLLEPTALLLAAPFHQREMLERMREELLDAERDPTAPTAADVSRYEEDLHVRATEDCPNGTLVDSLRQSQMLLLATNRLVPLYLGMQSIEPFFAEHRLVVELLLSGAPESAACALDAHLQGGSRRLVQRLTELRKSQPNVPSYLLGVGSSQPQN